MTRDERRRHPRRKPEPGYVLTCTAAEFAGKATEPYNLGSRLLDVSAGGACLVTVGRLREGLPVLIEIAFPATRDLFRAKAAICWSRTVESTGSERRTAHVAGLRFGEVLEARGGKVAPVAGERALEASREPRRRHKRFTPQEVEIVCLPRGFWRGLGFGSNVGRHLKDLSVGGAQIVSATRLEPGRKVDLKLTFRKPPAVVQAQGEVRWCRRDTLSVEPRWYAGVVFRRIAPASNQNLLAIGRLFVGPD